jgi:hypothetical protein
MLGRTVGTLYVVADTLHLPTAMQSVMLRATMIHSNVVEHA